MCTPNEVRRVVVIFIILIAYTGIAMAYDFNTWKIPNIYVVFGIMAGIFTTVIYHGKSFFRYSLVGILVPVMLLFLLFLLKAIGGGDIKLFSAVGSFVGADIRYIMLYSFIAGGIISFIFLIRIFVKSITSRKNNSITDITNCPGIRRELPMAILVGLKAEESPLKEKIHFSLAIFAGTVIYSLREMI